MMINQAFKRPPRTESTGPPGWMNVEGYMLVILLAGSMCLSSGFLVLGATGSFGTSMNLVSCSVQEGSEAVPAEEAEALDEPLFSARQNELLRDHFRRLYPFKPDPGSSPGTDLFVENYIDGQIDNFIAQLDERLKRLDTSASTLAELHRKVLRTDASARDPNDMRVVAETLKSIEEDADFAYDYLSLAFPTFWTKPRFDAPERDAVSRENLYQEQFDLLFERNRTALAKIRDYLFSNVSTVSLIELQEASMLSSLHSVRELAKWLRKRID